MQMNVDVEGRVRNTHLAKSNALLPLFEAVINGIHAAEEGPDHPMVEVKIHRDPQESLIEDSRHVAAVKGFTVTDNGIGFNDEHMQSFLTSDTRKKEDKGSKGVGRFLWLKAFSHAEIQSTFDCETGGRLHRKFRFALAGIDEKDAGSVTSSPRGTAVALEGFVKLYAASAPKGVDVIARRILEHCLEYFLDVDPPKIEVYDGKERTDLGALFNSLYSVEGRRTISIDSTALEVVGLRMPPSHDHMLYWCAHKRVVEDDKLALLLRNLDGPLVDPGNGQEFAYAAYVRGGPLDESVSADRTYFHIPSEPAPMLPHEVSWRGIRAAVKDDLEAHLRPHTEHIRAKKGERIAAFVGDHPEFRLVNNKRPGWVEAIPLDISDEKLEIELYRIQQQYTVELKEKGMAVLSRFESKEEFEDYRSIFTEFMADWNELNQSQLVEYVIHRKSVLAFLEKALQLQDGGEYAKEDRVHSILFPVRETSDSTPLDDQNLWIVDERLTYHQFLASDLPLSKIKAIQSDERKRPDLVVFNEPAAFTADEDSPHGSVVIIELKRPMRDDYAGGEKHNPIEQVYGYIRKIQAGKAPDLKGRIVNIRPATPFYCYILADITDSLHDQAANHTLTKTPDGMGYFGFNANLDAYIEIVSFDKLLGDAKKRNAVFFRKLGLK